MLGYRKPLDSALLDNAPGVEELLDNAPGVEECSLRYPGTAGASLGSQTLGHPDTAGSHEELRTGVWRVGWI